MNKSNRTALIIAVSWTAFLLSASSAIADEPADSTVIDIGSRRELFVDALLIECFQAKRSSITDVVFMTARPGSDRYERSFKEAFIRPGPGPSGWGNRSNYVAWHVVPTSDSEMSMYMYGGGHYVLRTDGFVSVHAGYETGHFVTKPFVFRGSKLDVSYATSAAGGIRVEIQNQVGEALDRFSLEDSDLLYGDEISHIVTWKQSPDVSTLAGQPIRLHFEMNEADLYSIRFMETEPQ